MNPFTDYPNVFLSMHFLSVVARLGLTSPGIWRRLDFNHLGPNYKAHILGWMAASDEHRKSIGLPPIFRV